MKWPSHDEYVSLSICLLTVACNREMQPFFIGYSLWGGGGGGGDIPGSGRVWALNLTVPLGSGRVRRSRVRAGFGLQF